jgi:hypothetical protein
MLMRMPRYVAALLLGLALTWQPGCRDFSDFSFGVKGCSGPAAKSTSSESGKGLRVALPVGLPPDAARYCGYGAGSASGCVDLDRTRIVAVGDLHGSLDATRLLLQKAGLTDLRDQWIGGKAILIQLGDQIDRGPHDREVIDLLEELRDAARAAGGAVYQLLANHEVMNVSLHFDHVSARSMAGFNDIPFDPLDAVIRVRPEVMRGRTAAFRPGGPYAKILAERQVVMILGGTLFSHAGVVRKYVEYGIDKINRETRRWMLDQGPRPNYLDLRSSPVWHRSFGEPDPRHVDCGQVRETLALVGAKRMVVGHTIQDKVNAACNGLLYRIDVGMYEGTKLGALTITGNKVKPATWRR